MLGTGRNHRNSDWSLLLLTAEELAELLQMSRITILRRAKRGSIPSFRVGSCVRFDSAAIAKWLMQQGVRSMSKG